MIQIKRYNNNRIRRAVRTRASLRESSELPRLTVFRSNTSIYAQVINQTDGKTLAGISGKKPGEVGEEIAKKALKLGIKKVVFDRGGYSYHGRVKILAEAARKAGLEF
ncbi:MAG: 50S ribosomal protein L18 [Candidatus Amesbacteria bacterium GW2011_GWB1_47_19]|nr:MAG: 50S ribosomal protein L18 [Candidatus Amesbacteria bacterium GW2011_GWA1_44_24]KKU32041.1 MAG: 50S ribosomal protein L18 [Candidatus Amesbacteria bacterium GW2011_GWC1_46_24]KKU67725.1 MAG: 50S ribosomal protein L18 [Candidatus Amesbacteria bacterium GW2011_GWB1_47_19]OGD06090.1 MAG: 50S ribosomal protein L18 [Candidatus Amesbacteria bacterium RIFOXYB1_FULL_47_13]HBC72319.1 50S ribosomal protein L18 [Candidatus Amesbacteria bacterium]